jgi:hypothetical protein
MVEPCKLLDLMPIDEMKRKHLLNPDVQRMRLWLEPPMGVFTATPIAWACFPLSYSRLRDIFSWHSGGTICLLVTVVQL